ncbi:DUF885 domain-containing protein [Sphingomonas turrisvirgatae]|uniref:Tat pathway signal protein n=1 Tax=Sphingomonas turrisvirgatae TaxID=1888892 RepID=A0A1E3LU03_9SPHN|nr:DUF885 family protein [Sphingomonas turrisvirgatae]ODP37226.1 Tat pathway signal protein [Sphingomonas turrisvirgatae]
MDRRTFLASGTATAALAATPAFARQAAQPAAGPADAALNKIFDEVLANYIARSPETATQIGFDKGPAKGKLDDRSPAGKVAVLADTRAGLARIQAVDPASLSEAAKLNREVVSYSLESQLTADKFKLDSVQRPFAIFQQGGVYFELPDFLNSTHTIATKDDAEALLSRLSQVGQALDWDTQAQADLGKRGILAPDFSLDLTLDQMAKLRSPAPIDNSMAKSLIERTAAKGIAGDWGTRAAKIIETSVYPALDRQMALIRQQRASARKTSGVWDVPQGDAIYAAALAQATTTNFTPDEVHKIGLEEVAQITAQLDAILKKQGLTKGKVGERLTALNNRPDQLYPDTPAGRAELIKSLNADNVKVGALLPRMFDNPTKAPLEIRAVPVEIQDGASNGYYHIAALDGSRPAIYWINLKSVADWPKYTLPSLTYHEGLPGHHLQLSEAMGAAGPLLRKFSFFGAYSEGWALYAEQVADELGAYAGDLERAGYLQSFLFRAARLVIDTGIHAKKWTREQATDYMVDTVGFARPRSQREIERYCTQPGQACSYKIGHTSWVRARAKAQAIAGDKFDVKRFHEVIRRGAVPLTILERLVEEDARRVASA